MKTFLVLLFAYLFSQFYRVFLAVIAGDLARDLGLGPQALGQLSAAWFAAFALMQFPVGWALDKIGPRYTTGGLMIAAALGALLLAGASGFAMALTGMALIGAGCSSVLMASLFVFGRNEPPARFAALTTMMIGFGNIGNLLSGAPLAFSAEQFGWRASLIAIAAANFLSAVLVLAALRDPARIAAPKSGSPVSELFEVIRRRSLWPLFPITLISYSVVVAERSLWMAPFLDTVHGVSRTAIGYAAFAMGAAMALGALAYGPAQQAIGSMKWTVVFGCLGTALGFLALVLIDALQPGLAITMLVLIGGLGLSYGILMSHARQFMPEHLLGRGMTFMNFLFIGGAGILQPLSGAAVERMLLGGMAPAAAYAWLHGVFGALLVVAVIIYCFSKEAAGPQRQS